MGFRLHGAAGGAGALMIAGARHRGPVAPDMRRFVLLSGAAVVNAGVPVGGFPGSQSCVKFMHPANCYFGGVIAAFAGAVPISIPAVLGAGGCLCGSVHQVMAQGGLLRVGRIAAAGTGLVGFPADGRAGRGLRCVVGQVMVVGVDGDHGGLTDGKESRRIFEEPVTEGAGPVGFRSRFGAGGFLFLCFGQLMPAHWQILG